MSYDLTICTPPIEANDEAAWGELDTISDTTGSVPPELKELYERLTEKYPCICTLPDDEVDDGVWSDGPLWNNFGARAAALGVVYSRIEEVHPFIVKTAHDLGLIVFDLSSSAIHRPPGGRRGLFRR